jgi:ATP-dependent RNA helicase RhlE
MLFKKLDIIKPILNALDKQGYKMPTPIQEKAIPHILD